MSFDEVVEALGPPDQGLAGLWRSDRRRAGWWDGLAVHFDPTVVFIETARDARFAVTIFGIDLDVFRAPAAEVVATLERRGHPAISPGPKAGYTYLFFDLQLAFWRQVVPLDP